MAAREEKKERLGAGARNRAMKREQSSNEASSEDFGSSAELKTPRQKKPRIVMEPFENDIETFTAALRQEDVARAKLIKNGWL